MKKHSLAVLTAFIGGFSPSHAVEEQLSLSQPPPAKATTARILGDIPPPPDPPKPQFIIPPEDILETQTHQQGGRTITVRKIAPIALPTPQKPSAPPADLNDPAIQECIVKLRAANRDHHRLHLGATVYRSSTAPPRSLVQWHQAEGEPVVIWSSADFTLLSGLSKFADASGKTIDLSLMWSVTDLDRRPAFQAKSTHPFKAPEIPEFPPGNATYIIASGNPSPQTLAAIQSLHDLYNNEHTRLATAYEGRQRAHLQREAELKANPPPPQDITLDYWRIERPAPAKGGAR